MKKIKAIALAVLFANICIFAQDSTATVVEQQAAEQPAEQAAEPPAQDSTVVAQDSTVVAQDSALVQDSIAAEPPPVVAEPPPPPLPPAVAEPPPPPPPVVVEQPAIQERAWNKGIQYGIGIGALGGISAQVGYRFPRSESFWKNRFGFRLDYSSLGPIWNQVKSIANKEGQAVIDEDVEIEGLTISDSKFKADLGSTHFGALVDFHPFGHTFFLGGGRISVGYYFGRMELKSKISNYRMIFEQEFDATVPLDDGINPPEDIPVNVSVKGELKKVDPLEMKIKLNASGPYVGLGYDLGIAGGLHLTFDAGIVRTINPHKVSLTIPELYIPDSTYVVVTPKEDVKDEDLQNYVDQLRGGGYCDVPGDPGIPACADFVINKEIVIPESMIEQYMDEYGDVLKAFNDRVKEAKDKALEGKKSKDGSDGVNTSLKTFPYFPILRFGIMWRF